MTNLSVEQVSRVFESRPVESAVWLVSLDAFAAIQKVLKEKRRLDTTREFAAARVLSSLENGNNAMVLQYIESPDKYPPGMTSYLKNLGARSIRGNLDPSIVAALTYRADKSVRAHLNKDSPALALERGARDFSDYFVQKVKRHAVTNPCPIREDLTIGIKNDTELWIDK